MYTLPARITPCYSCAAMIGAFVLSFSPVEFLHVSYLVVHAMQGLVCSILDSGSNAHQSSASLVRLVYSLRVLDLGWNSPYIVRCF